MPTSQVAAWFAVLRCPLYPSVFYTALFYCLWALYNKYLGGVDQELGHYTMGLLALASFFHHRKSSMAATCLVLLNFIVPSYFILYKWDLTELAATVKNDTSEKAIVWAVVFKAYFVSQIALWSVVFYKLLGYHENSYQRVPVPSTGE